SIRADGPERNWQRLERREVVRDPRSAASQRDPDEQEGSDPQKGASHLGMAPPQCGSVGLSPEIKKRHGSFITYCSTLTKPPIQKGSSCLRRDRAAILAAMSQNAINPTRSQNYPEWYQEVIKAADMAENSPVRGCMVI